ncbi:MAG TPA: hypothetical protein IAA05_08345 [Candidatus Blautia excrementipullorum]|nr:hypothetical protein [Candidatus Blautia excrementipullorum]
MKRSIKWYVVALFSFLVVLVICTYISSQVYKHSLVQVEIGTVQGDSLRETCYFEGIIEALHYEEYQIPAACRIVEVYCHEGQYVEEGEALCKVDTLLLEIEYLKKEEEMTLLRENTDVNDRLNQLEIEVLEIELEQLGEILEQGGVIVARQEGEIMNIPELDDYEMNQTLITCGDMSQGIELVWYISLETPFPEIVYCSIPGEEAERRINREDYTYFYDYTSNNWKCSVVLDEITTNVHIGSRVQMNASMITEEYYPYILPDSAIHYDSSTGSNYIFCLESRETSMGMEYYVRQRGVDILGSMGGYTAITADPKSQVVISSSGQLSDLQVVKIVQTD